MARKMRQIRYQFDRWRGFVEMARSGAINELQSAALPDQRCSTTNATSGFMAEVKSRRLARKMRNAKDLSDSSNDEDEQFVSSNIPANTNITKPPPGTNFPFAGRSTIHFYCTE